MDNSRIMDEMNAAIYKRMSNRKYKMEILSHEILTEIEDFLKSLKPLNKEIAVRHKIVKETKNLLPVRAPYYLLIYSEEKEGYLANVGFMFEQFVLFLSALGLGACWLGMAKPKEKEDEKRDFIIAIGFGEPSENPTRAISDFKRKPAEDVYHGTDERLEAARLAPSAVNSQNWFFEESEGSIDVYQKKLNSLQNLVLGKMNQIDIGIAICHLYVSTVSYGKNFDFQKIHKHKRKTGYNYVGTVI